MIFFEKCDVSINGTGILAETASISSNAQQTPVTVLGFRSPQGFTTAGNFQNSVELNYFFEVYKEPSYKILNQTKNNLLNPPPVTIVIGGISGTYYLENYRVQVSEHQPVMVTASFVGFSMLSGSLTDSPDRSIYTTGFHTGIANYYSSFVSLKYVSPYDVSSVFYYLYEPSSFSSCSYAFKNSIQPIYTIGSFYPIEVKQMSAEETIEIIHDNFSKLTPIGLTPLSGLGMPPTYEFKNGTSVPEVVLRLNTANTYLISNLLIWEFASFAGLDLPYFTISSGVVQSTRLEASAGNVMRTNTMISRFY